jgi:protein subunit release factor B
MKKQSISCETERIAIVSKKDLEISYFVGSGDGGQNRQKNSTGVQIIHRESGAMGRCSETRSQFQNRKRAFENLCRSPKMRLWISRKLMEIRTGKTLEERVDEQMQSKHLRVQIKDPEGRWVDISPDERLP